MYSQRTEGTCLVAPEWKTAVALTVDVEDYFMSPECIPLQAWPSFPSTIHTGMERVLNLLDRYQAKATFFFLGWIAERYPELVHWTAEKGHEIATHTYDHRFVSSLDENQFAESVTRSLIILRELASGQSVVGHRAPAFSLDRNQSWPFEILRKNGIVYDSSINPHSTYLYGDRQSLRFPHELHGLVEIPPGVVQWAGIRMPVGGGGTLRILPHRYLRWARHRYQSEGYPPVLYIHPWEFVPEHPSIPLPPKLRFIHWTGIQTTEEKVRIILEENSNIRIIDYFQKLIEQNNVFPNREKRDTTK